LRIFMYKAPKRGAFSRQVLEVNTVKERNYESQQ
jgi:hypothetical protein